jgi:hypothetical protein
MRPNTPHSVVTIEASICRGGHFLSTSAIRDTVFGYLNSFVGSSLVTNTEHTSDAQLQFRYLIRYYHSVYIGKEGTNAGESFITLKQV